MKKILILVALSSTVLFAKINLCESSYKHWTDSSKTTMEYIKKGDLSLAKLNFQVTELFAEQVITYCKNKSSKKRIKEVNNELTYMKKATTNISAWSPCNHSIALLTKQIINYGKFYKKQNILEAGEALRAAKLFNASVLSACKSNRTPEELNKMKNQVNIIDKNFEELKASSVLSKCEEAVFDATKTCDSLEKHINNKEYSIVIIDAKILKVHIADMERECHNEDVKTPYSYFTNFLKRYRLD